MSQSGYTPILIYASGSTGNTPSATNLTSSASGAELALNYFDGKLFYKDASGNVQVLASKAATSTTISFGTTGLTPSTASTGAITVAGTLITSNGGTGLTSFTANGVVYASSTSALATGSGITYNGTTFSTSNDASIHGLTVGQGSGSVSNNTAVGSGALGTVNTGAFNDSFGFNSLNSNTSGTTNTAIGSGTLFANLTGSYNVAIGRTALSSNTTASYNTALGYQSLYSNTVAGYSVALGYQAGYSYNRTADNNNGYNTFVGPFAGYYCTTGRANTVVGGFNGNQGGLDIRTSSNYIVLADGDGNPQGYYTNTSLYWSFVNQVRTPVLYATGTGNAGGVYLGAGTSNGLISQASAGSGTITTYIGNQAITTISDSRLKENVVDTTRNGLQLVNQLRVVDHTWNDPSDQCENNRNSRGVWMGLIAQEAQPIIPWLVNKPTKDIDEEGNPQYWHMDYGYSVPLLIKAIQELSAQVTALQAKVGA